MTQKSNPTGGGQADLDPTISYMIDEAVKQGLRRKCSLYDMGDNGEVTPEAIQMTRERLRAFPDVCLRAQEADGPETILLNYEIWAMKSALIGISGDPYYQIVPDLYFHGLTTRAVSLRANCDTSTVWRNEKRLLSELALWLYGVAARWRHPLFVLPAPLLPVRQ